jgi:RimJ/RimL family protein N-acetyltransferase
MMTEQKLTVREMALDEVGMRIDYFHGASDDHLRLLGVDRALLPTRETWLVSYEEDHGRPIRERLNYSLVWELDWVAVGFSSADRIDFGESAFMHLHILESAQRQRGLGATFVGLSAQIYFHTLQLKRLFCEPNAFNVAPNRALQRAGFTYQFTHETTPTPINFLQPVTRWVLDHPPR